jgi:tRNA-dihydrouridine synthase
MRLVARRRGCPYAVTEALLDTILCNGGHGLRKSIDINDEDHPVAGQVIGADPDTMSRAASLLQQAGYDVIDLNFACPVKKIKNKARGGHMLLDVDRALSILKSVRDVLPPETPTTISLRRAFDDSPEATDRFYQILEAAWANGYSAIRVHGRTVEQKYAGPACWKSIRQVKQRYPDRTILGSGDVFTAEDAVRMLRETGIDIVWIARGAIGNPWIFQHARALLALSSSPGTPGEGRGEGRSMFENAGPHPNPSTSRSPRMMEHRESGQEIGPPSIHEQRDALHEHFSLAMQIHGEQLAGRRMRKMGIKYSRFHPLASEVKTHFINVRSRRDWTNVLDRFYSTDGPGVWPDPKAADEVNEPENQTCESAV